MNHADDPDTGLALRDTTSAAEQHEVGGPDDPKGSRQDLNSPYFIRGAQSGRIYRMVGGAPAYVPSWAPLGGPRQRSPSMVAIDRAGQPGAWRFLHRYPKDRWFVRSAQTGQVYTIAGGAPVYVATQNLLGDHWFHWIPVTVDQAVIDRAGGAAPYDRLRYVPADGSLLYPTADWENDDPFATPTGWYRVRNGALDPAGLRQDFLDHANFNWPPVDQVTVDRAGQPGPWFHLRTRVP